MRRQSVSATYSRLHLVTPLDSVLRLNAAPQRVIVPSLPSSESLLSWTRTPDPANILGCLATLKLPSYPCARTLPLVSATNRPCSNGSHCEASNNDIWWYDHHQLIASDVSRRQCHCSVLAGMTFTGRSRSFNR